MNTDFYTSIKTSTENILTKVKGSKFIGFAYPVASITEVQGYIEQLKKDHPNATHHCYAYLLNTKEQRANDDGEPSGTAGLPILNQILKETLNNILIVVIRYYGGTKLGVGGLKSAYKECAIETLQNCQVHTIDYISTYQLNFAISEIQLVMQAISKFDCSYTDTYFGNQCTFEIKIAKKNSTAFKNLIATNYKIILKDLE